MKCPSCQSENPDKAKFCNECGQHLIPSIEGTGAAISPQEKLERIQKYLPQGLAEKILAQKDKLEGELRQVTTMFCDISGFTPLSAKLGPERAFSLMDGVYEILIQKVNAYEGTVNELRGDGILALFGAPIALEDAPQRAILSALAIQQEMTRFNEEIRDEIDMPPILLRIGINTGPVVLGAVGNNLMVQFTVVGDTINLASRMESLAEPGTIYVTEDTFKLTEGLFRFEALGEKKVKGKEDPVVVYRVIGPSTRRTRFDISAERGLSPFVGRARELELLVDALGRARKGRGQALSIVSEAGAGKSRLLYEFRKAAANENVNFLEGRCLSYSSRVEYFPVIDILKTYFDIRDSDGDLQVREKVEEGLDILGEEKQPLMPHVLELMSVKDSGIHETLLSTEARKDRIVQAFKLIAQRSSETKPLILAFEDLHWMDKSSEVVFKHVLNGIDDTRVLLIFTYRQEFAPAWSVSPNHSRVTLNRLSNRESLAMVSHLLNTAQVDGNLEDFILEKTDGIPFFVEEFIRSIQELKIIEKKRDKYFLVQNMGDATVPSTIQDVIMTRVDSLPEGTKEVLQTLSAIEREFSYGLIKRVLDLPEKELLSHLSALTRMDFLYLRGMFPRITYIFKHAVTRDVIYSAILSRKRMKLHEEAGKAIEAHYQDNLQGHYDVLADHFFKSGSYKKASEYAKLACDKAAISASVPVAIAHARRRVMCLERLPEDGAVRRELVEARTSLAIHLFLMHDYAEAKEALDPIVELAENEGLKDRLSQIYTIIGSYDFTVNEDPAAALRHLKKALKISEETEDIFSSFFANYLLSLAYSWNCEFDKTSVHMEKALEFNLVMNNPWGVSVTKSNLSLYGLNCMGRVGKGFDTSFEAWRLAEESGDVLALAIATVCHGISCYYKGRPEDAEDFLMKGIEFCERIDLRAFGALANHWLGCVLVQNGKYEEASRCLGRSIELREEIGFSPSAVKLTKTVSAHADALRGEKSTDLEVLKRYAIENNVKFYEGSFARHLGLTMVRRADDLSDEAVNWFKRAASADEANGMRWDLGSDHLALGRLYGKYGNRPRAVRSLEIARGIFLDCNADGWAREAEQALEAL